VISVKRFFARMAVLAVLSLALSLMAFVGIAAGGVLVVNPPSGVNPPADCVGPGAPSSMPNLAPWNAHFNGAAPDGTSAVDHPGTCPEELP
jgi:hypothetical protein